MIFQCLYLPNTKFPFDLVLDCNISCSMCIDGAVGHHLTIVMHSFC